MFQWGKTRWEKIAPSTERKLLQQQHIRKIGCVVSKNERSFEVYQDYTFRPVKKCVTNLHSLFDGLIVYRPVYVRSSDCLSPPTTRSDRLPQKETEEDRARVRAHRLFNTALGHEHSTTSSRVILPNAANLAKKAKANLAKKPKAAATKTNSKKGEKKKADNHKPNHGEEAASHNTSEKLLVRDNEDGKHDEDGNNEDEDGKLDEDGNNEDQDEKGNNEYHQQENVKQDGEGKQDEDDSDEEDDTEHDEDGDNGHGDNEKSDNEHNEDEDDQDIVSLVISEDDDAPISEGEENEGYVHVLGNPNPNFNDTDEHPHQQQCKLMKEEGEENEELEELGAEESDSDYLD